MTEDEMREICIEGYNYRFGLKGYPIDPQKAFELFTKAADANSADAMYALGRMYKAGHYVRQDFKEAYEWFARAVLENDRLFAPYSDLAELFYYGKGVEKNYEASLECSLKAIENNSNTNSETYSNDCFRVGMLLTFVFKRYKDAFAYFYESATKGNNAAAWHNLGYLCREKLVPGENKDTAFQYFMKGAELGYPDSMYEVGLYYIEKTMYNEGMPWVEKAAANGSALAQKNLKLLRKAHAATKGSLFGTLFG